MYVTPKRRAHLHAMLDQLLDESSTDHGILLLREVTARRTDGSIVHALSARGVVGKESTIVRDLVKQIRKP